MNLAELKEAVQELMSATKGYIEIATEDGDSAPYAVADAERCSAILEEYLSYLFVGERTNAEIIAQVEITVKALNELNSKCGCSLIETDERERICEIIIEAAKACGYQVPDEDDDITFEWRDW